MEPETEALSDEVFDKLGTGWDSRMSVEMGRAEKTRGKGGI
jgi:hypothetical protein